MNIGFLMWRIDSCLNVCVDGGGKEAYVDMARNGVYGWCWKCALETSYADELWDFYLMRAEALS